MSDYALTLPHGIVTILDSADAIRDLSCEFSDGFVWTGYLDSVPWYAVKKPHTTYVVASVHRSRQQYQVRLHRALVGALAADHVDHRDGNGLNNRQINLRRADPQGNARNRGLNQGKQFKGVSFHKQSGRWTAQIKYGGKKHHLGLFPTPELAACAYDERAAKEFGEFARLNFPAKEVSIKTEPSGVVQVKF